jgi:hypothetical protein
MPTDKGFIPGIYNYCDRWCERCAHTSRCRVFRDSERMKQRHRREGKDPDTIDVALEDVARNFQKVRRMLERFAEAEGLDLDAIVAEGGEDLACQRAERDALKHPVMQSAQRYTDLAAPLLERLRPLLNDALDNTRQRAEFMDVAAEADTLAVVRNAFEVLSWDHMLVSVKIRRAVEGKLEADQEADELGREFHLQDAAGSAHVARKCLGRDMVALTRIYEWHGELRDAVIELLTTAERTRRALEAEIPECVEFAWPPAE